MEDNRQDTKSDEVMMVTEESVNDDVGEPTLYGKEFFNIERHNLITGTAARLLSANTNSKVQEILAPINQVFDDLGGWADEIKKAPASRPDDSETQAFFEDERNRSHKTWHYVNLPLMSGGADGTNAYAEASELGFTRDTDVVQMIRECVSVLQGESDRFSEINALRLLGHLVGDVHQPLHIGCGFIDDRTDPPKFVKDPQLIRQHNFKSDTGGNKIALPGAGKMHSYWDAGLGGLIDNIELDAQPEADLAADDGELKAQLIEKLYGIAVQDFAAEPVDGGAEADNIPVSERAEQWANESLLVARKAYETLRIVEETASGYKVSWEGKTKYNERCAELLRNQMAMGARHLAQMLNAIYD